MTDPELHPAARSPSGIELLVDFIKVRLWSVLMLTCGIGAIAVFLGFDISVPRWMHVFALTFAFLLPLGYFTAKKVVSLLYDPNIIYLVDSEAENAKGALYAFPYQDFLDLDVTDGDLAQYANRLYIGQNVDLDALTAEGNWAGTLDDLELLRALSKVDECRGQLEEQAKRGFALETQLWTIVRNATREATRSVVDTFKRGSLPDEGDSVDAQIDAALAQFDLDDDLDDLDDDDEPTPEQVETDPEPTPETADSGPETGVNAETEAPADD